MFWIRILNFGSNWIRFQCSINFEEKSLKTVFEVKIFFNRFLNCVFNLKLSACTLSYFHLCGSESNLYPLSGSTTLLLSTGTGTVVLWISKVFFLSIRAADRWADPAGWSGQRRERVSHPESGGPGLVPRLGLQDGPGYLRLQPGGPASGHPGQLARLLGRHEGHVRPGGQVRRLHCGRAHRV